MSQYEEVEEQEEQDSSAPAVESILRLFHSLPRTEVTDVASTAEGIHMTVRVSEHPVHELWWKDLLITIHEEELEQPWTSHTCCEYRLVPGGGDLGYVWNIILSNAPIEVIAAAMDGVFNIAESKSHERRRVDIDRIPLYGGADRNKPADGSSKGALFGMVNPKRGRMGP